MTQEVKKYRLPKRPKAVTILYCTSQLVAVPYKGKVYFITEGMALKAKRANQYGMIVEGLLYGNSRQIGRIYISDEVWMKNFRCFRVLEVCSHCSNMTYKSHMAACTHKLGFAVANCPRVRAENSH